MKVWRYQSWESYSPSEQKRRTLVATLKKVAAMASSEKEMMNSAMAKLREFADLGYPASVWKDACCHVASSGGSAICHVAEQRWFRDLDRRGADASAKTALFGQGMFLDGAFLP